MDARGTTATEVTIQNGRITAVGPTRQRLEPVHARRSTCAAAPPCRGSSTTTTTSSCWASAPATTRGSSRPSRSRTSRRPWRRAPGPSRPTGSSPSMGGWNPVQFAEKRLPTLAELDAAVSTHPVLALPGLHRTRPPRTRRAAPSSPRRASRSATPGSSPPMPRRWRRSTRCAAMQTLDDRKRGTLDALAYSARLGVTTSTDMGAFNLPGTANLQEIVRSRHAGQRRPVPDVRRGRRAPARRTALDAAAVFFLTMDTRPDVPVLAERLRTTFDGFGDDMLKVSGIGEFASAWPLFGQAPPTNYGEALARIARAGWAFQQHSLSAAENELTIADVRDRQQDHAHRAAALVPGARGHRRRAQDLARLKAIGAAVAVHPYQYLAGGRGGPPLRTIVDSGIKAGAGSDSAQISTLNPWNIISYMVTGRSSDGTLINAGQQLTRMEALRLYTAENGWFLREEGVTRHHRAGQVGRRRGAERRLLQPHARARRPDSQADLGADRGRRPGRPRGDCPGVHVEVGPMKRTR